MRPATLILSGLLMLLAACGNDGDTPQVENTPGPTAEPTRIADLPLQDRVQNTPGSVGNPFRMVLVPDDTVVKLTRDVLAALTQTPADEIQADTRLREDLGLAEDLAELEAPIQAAFAVQLRRSEYDEISIVADLEAAIYRRIGEQLTVALAARSALYVEIVFTNVYGEGLSALCGGETGLVSIAWLDATTLQAAQALNCGLPALLVGRGDPAGVALAPIGVPETLPEVTPEVTPDAALTPSDAPPDSDASEDAMVFGQPVQLMVARELGTTDLSLLETRSICRRGLTDSTSWLLPSLILAAADVDPAGIVDVASAQAAVDAVLDGTCGAAGFSQSERAGLMGVEDLVVAYETPPLPFAVMAYPFEIELGVRLSLTENLIALAQDPIEGRWLALLLGQEVLVSVDAVDLAPLDAFFLATGYDFAELGQ